MRYLKKSSPRLIPLRLQDKNWIDRYFCSRERELSSYNFASIYVWKDIFDFYYRIINGSLCIFAQNHIGTFLYLPPLGARISRKLLDTCFKIMDSLNQSSGVSRIENIEDKDAHIYESLGFRLRPKDKEYLYEKGTLVQLQGNRFKSKRAGYNYFLKHYRFSYGDFQPQDKQGCLDLYRRWARQRKIKYPDPIFKDMLRVNHYTHRVAMDDFDKLNLKGMVVEVNKKIAGYSFGYPLNKNTFCILFEITDPAVKGLSQFIFRQFCSELDGHNYINVMDDSGLDNLRRSKLSYRPIREVESFIAQRE